MSDVDIRAAKAAIRAELLAARRVLDEEVRRVLSLSIGERIVRLDAYRRAEVIHVYIGALDGEVETRDLVSRALRSGKRVLCPRAERTPRRLEHFEIRSLDDLEQTALGLWEPNPQRAVRADPEEASVVIVPGIAFDREGWRIGYGAGYYDRFLAACEATTVGLAYSFQVRGAVPHEAHDVAVDFVVTEVESIDTRPSAAG